MKRLLLASLVALGLLGTQVFAASIVVNDTMTGTGGTDLNAHTADNSCTWTRATGFTRAMVITDANRVRINATGGDGIYYSSCIPGKAEFNLDLDIRCLTFPADLHLPMIFGRIDTSGINGYRAIYDSSGTPTWHLQVYTAGSWSEIGSGFALTMSAATTYHYRLQVRNTFKKFFIDGTERISSSDNTNSATGRIGIGEYADTVAAGNSTFFHFDNVVVTLLGRRGILLTLAFSAPWSVSE